MFEGKCYLHISCTVTLQSCRVNSHIHVEMTHRVEGLALKIILLIYVIFTYLYRSVLIFNDCRGD